LNSGLLLLTLLGLGGYLVLTFLGSTFQKSRHYDEEDYEGLNEKLVKAEGAYSKV
jgi:hypothetical protein